MTAFDSDRARENEKHAIAFAEQGDWDNAIKYARLVPKNWDIWQRFPSIKEGGLPPDALNKVLNVIPRDSLPSFLFETAHNLHPQTDSSTLDRLAKLGLEDHSLQHIISKHPNYSPSDETKGHQMAAKFWNSYESKVAPHHFATVKSLYTGKPETLTDHRGNSANSHGHHVISNEKAGLLDNAFYSYQQAGVGPNKDIKLHDVIPHLPAHAAKVQHAIMNDEFIPKRYFNGKPYIQLHRGVGGSYAKKLREKIKHNPENQEIDHKNFILPTAHLTSWTTDPEMAERFASSRGEHDNVHEQGVVLSAWHPVESVLHSGFHTVTPGQNHTHVSESEIVVGHPAGKMKINSKNMKFQNKPVPGVPQGGSVNVTHEDPDYHKLKEVADKTGAIKLEEGKHGDANFHHPNFIGGRVRKSEELLAGLLKIRDLLRKSVQGMEKVTAGRHSEAPGQAQPTMTKPVPERKHIRADTQTHLNLKIEKSFAGAGGTGVAAVSKVWKDELPGGKADQKKPSQFNQQNLKEGANHETEHTRSKHLASEIAMDHLTEDPEYYKKLQRIEKSWEVKVKGHEGYHPVKDIQDLGPEKGNNYILHSGRIFHQSQLEDMRPIVKAADKVTKSQLLQLAKNALNNFGQPAEELEKADAPPRFKGEKHPTKPYVADRHNFGVTWFYNPEIAKKYEADIQANRQGFLNKFPAEHHPVINHFIDHVLSQRNRHAVVAQDVRNGPDMPRARHLRGLMMGDNNYKLDIHDPKNLTLTSFERHGGHNPRGSQFKHELPVKKSGNEYNVLEMKADYARDSLKPSQNQGHKGFSQNAEVNDAGKPDRKSLQPDNQYPRQRDKAGPNEISRPRTQAHQIEPKKVPKALEVNGRQRPNANDSASVSGLSKSLPAGSSDRVSGRSPETSSTSPNSTLTDKPHTTNNSYNGTSQVEPYLKLQKFSANSAHQVIPPKRLAKSGIPQIASIAVLSGNSLLMGKRQDNDRWTLPGGHMDGGEDPISGARRELMEETGIYVEPEALSYLGSEPVVTFTGKQIIVHCFLTKGNFKTDSSNDPDAEVAKWQYVDVKNGLPEPVSKNLHSPKNCLLKKLGLQ